MPGLFARPAILIFVLSLLPALASAAPPAAPAVSVGAGFKQLRFDFEPVSGASFYQLWFRPNGGAAWVKYMENTAATSEFKITVSAHLLDWFNARYYVTACNSEGCSRTANISVTSLMRDTVGYFKQRATAIEPWVFGEPALSADGTTLAVLGGETRGPRKHSAAVMVYRKGATGWVQEARLEPTPVEEDTARPAVGRNIAVNGKGTVVVVGLPYQYVPGPNASDDGAAFIFRRGSSGWVLEKKLELDPVRSWLYAKVVDVDDAGETVAIWRPYLDGQGDGSQQGAVEIHKYAAGAWNLQTVLPVPYGVSSCEGFALSGNGRILARVCGAFGEIFELQGTQFVRRQTFGGTSFAPYVDTSFDGGVIVSSNGSTVPAGATWHPYYTVYRRDASGWQPDPGFTYLGRATKPPSNSFNGPVTISGDGRFIAVGSYSDTNAGSGVVRGPLTRNSDYSGAVFVFEHKSNAWALRNMIKPNVPSKYLQFGYGGVSFGDNGKILAVGSPFDDSGARGIDGDQTDASAPDSGAAWLY